MRPAPRLAFPLVLSLALTAPASAAPFCRTLPPWAEGPCFAALGFVSSWLPEGPAVDRQGKGATGRVPVWLPEGGTVDPDGRRIPPPPPPAPVAAPTESPADTL